MSADGNQRIQIREKTLEFSSTVLSTLPSYLTENRREKIKKVSKKHRER